MTSLVAENITVRAGDATLVNDATVSLNPGELVAILGPNGAGKTSLLRAMLGLAPIAGGTATLDGLGPVGDGAHAAHEFIQIDSLVERGALLTMMLLAPCLSKQA